MEIVIETPLPKLKIDKSTIRFMRRKHDNRDEPGKPRPLNITQDMTAGSPCYPCFTAPPINGCPGC